MVMRNRLRPPQGRYYPHFQPHRSPTGSPFLSIFLLLGIIPAPIGENRAIAEFYNFSPSEPPQFFNIHD